MMNKRTMQLHKRWWGDVEIRLSATGTAEGEEDGAAALNSPVSAGLTEKVTVKQRLEGGREESILGRGKSARERAGWPASGEQWK